MYKIPYYYALSRYREYRGYWHGVVVNYRMISSIVPHALWWRPKLATALLKDGEYTQALKVLNSIPVPLSLDLELVRAKVLMGLNDYEEAVQIFNGVFEKSKSVDSFVKPYVKALLALDDYEGAVALLESIPGDSYQVYKNYYAGYCYEKLNKGAESRGCYDRAIKASKDNKVRRFGLGILHLRYRNFPQAVALLEEESIKGSDDAELFFQLGRAYSGLPDNKKAARAYQLFIESENGSGENSINSRLVVFDAFMGRNYTDSPKYIYEYMLNSPEYRDYSFVWVLRRGSYRREIDLKSKPRTVVVRHKSKDYFRAYARAKYWVTNSRLPFVLKSHPEQVYLQTWHGTPLKRIGHDIINESKDDRISRQSMNSMYDEESKKLDYFVSPSAYASEKFISSFALEKVRKTDAIIEQGYPRNDRLARYTDEEVARVRKRFGIPPDKKVLLYAPTWRDNQRVQGRGYTYRTEVDFEYLQRYLSDEWVVLFRPHYFVANNFDFAKYRGFIKDASQVEDINELYIASDVLMTDYSSVFFDYANLGRPVIFFMYDLEEYRDDIRGFYMSLAELPGDIIQDEAGIVGVLRDLSAYQDRHRVSYAEFNKKFNYLDDGGATRRVVERVFR